VFGIRLSVGGANPLPLSPTVCVPALPVNVNVPAADPDCVGVNSTLTGQACPAASALDMQLFIEIENGPVIVIAVKVTG
jgi:hypothetical protein